MDTNFINFSIKNKVSTATVKEPTATKKASQSLEKLKTHFIALMESEIEAVVLPAAPEGLSH